MAEFSFASLRPVSLDVPAERAALLAIIQAHEDSVPGAEIQNEETVVLELTSSDTEPAELYLAASGTAADASRDDVLVHLQWLPASESVWADVYAEPHVPAGVLAQFMEVALDGLRARISTPEWTAQTGCYGGDARAAEFYAASGFSFARRFLRMSLTLDDDRPDPGQLPDGFSVREIAAHDLEGQRVVHAVREETFADHWNHHVRTFDEWIDVMNTQRDPGMTRRSWVVYRDDEPAAVMIVDDSRAELDLQYIGILGVLPQFRGHGLAKWLLRRGFQDAYDLGRTGVVLTVDSESKTGADKLYLAVGMTPSAELLAWHRPLGA